MPFGISWPEILILLLVALLVFGPKKLPEMGRSLGQGLREFKDSVTGKDDDRDELESGERADAESDEDETPARREAEPQPAAQGKSAGDSGA